FSALTRERAFRVRCITKRPLVCSGSRHQRCRSRAAAGVVRRGTEGPPSRAVLEAEMPQAVARLLTSSHGVPCKSATIAGSQASDKLAVSAQRTRRSRAQQSAELGSRYETALQARRARAPREALRRG